MFGLSSELAVIEQSAERLLLQQRPYFWWLVTGVCVLVALNDFRGGNYFFGLIFLGGGIFALVTTPTINVAFNRSAGSVTYSQTILGRGESESLSLERIRGVEVETGLQVSGVTRQSQGNGYRVRLNLEGDAYFPLTPHLSAHKEPKEAAAKAVAAFLNVPLDGAKPAAGEASQ